jgi:hypothetical protein
MRQLFAVGMHIILSGEYAGVMVVRGMRASVTRDLTCSIGWGRTV